VKLKYEKQVKDVIRRLIVPPGKKVSLTKGYDPGYRPKNFDKKRGLEMLSEGIALMAEYQDKLYAQDRYALLIVLQALDAAGKDGIVKHVMSGLNPQGCDVRAFKAPSSEELDHDYLWRCFKALPERGRIGIFNRSYYEEVLVTRVHPEILAHQKLPEHTKTKDIFKRRYEEINNFEEYLTNNGTVVLKFYLNISKQEQQKRFLERIDRPEKNWKFSAADAKERACWSDYMSAYEDCFRHTSTKWAPWYVVPANHKPVARLAVAAVIYSTLASLNLAYPKVTDEHREELQKVKVLLEGEGKS
jgi:PPK2 family polyphosphate:nucleotide phosphotransferase